MVILREYLLLLIPLFLVNLALIIVALVDLRNRKQVWGNAKWLWVMIILFVQFLGPIIYLVFGKKEE